MQQLSIGAVAQLTQIPAHTLRKWESRHQIGVPIRSETGRRVYTQEHVELLRLVKALVDNGHALAHLANLDLEQLRDLASLHTQTPAQTQIASLSLVGPNICWLLSGSGLVTHRHPGNLADWKLNQTYADAEGLALECDTIPPDVLDDLLQTSTDITLLIVIYKFAARSTIRTLGEHGIIAIQGPAEDADLLSHIDGRVPPSEFTRTPQRFSVAELGRIAALSPGLQCECPNHIAKLLMDISSFEQYSDECLDTDPSERALHQKLGDISAQARRLFEDALIAVAAADGIQLTPKP